RHSRKWEESLLLLEMASVTALELLNSGYEFDEASIILIDSEEKPIFSLNTIVSAESMSIYNDIDADVLQNYQGYNLANIIYYSEGVHQQ
ncbi:ATP synthase subunit gamma, mitochondrial, partial [Saguinus oedipus]